MLCLFGVVSVNSTDMSYWSQFANQSAGPQSTFRSREALRPDFLMLLLRDRPRILRLNVSLVSSPRYWMVLDGGLDDSQRVAIKTTFNLVILEGSKKSLTQLFIFSLQTMAKLICISMNRHFSVNKTS